METTTFRQIIEELRTYKSFFGQSLPQKLIQNEAPIENFTNDELEGLLKSWDKENGKFVVLEKENHRFLLSILNQFPFYIYWKDSNLVYRGCNQNFADAFDLPMEGIIGKSDTDLYDKEKATYYQDLERNVIRKGIRNNDLRKEEEEDGTIKVINSITIPLMGTEGEFIGVLGFSWSRSNGGPDIQKLRQDAENYKRRIENSQFIYLEFNQMGYISYVNKRIEETLFFKPENLLGANIRQLLAEEDWINFNKIREVVEINSNFPFVFRFKRNDGEFLKMQGDLRSMKNGYAIEMQTNWPEKQQIINAMDSTIRESGQAFQTITSFLPALKNMVWDKLTGQEKMDFSYAINAAMGLRQVSIEGQRFLEVYENPGLIKQTDLGNLLESAQTIVSALIAGYEPIVRYDILPSLMVSSPNMITFFEKILLIGSKLSDDFKEVNIDIKVQEKENLFEFTIKYFNCNAWKLPKTDCLFQQLNNRTSYSSISGLSQLLIICDFIISKHCGLIKSHWDNEEYLCLNFSLPKK